MANNHLFQLKKISVFLVTGLNILVRVSAHIFFWIKNIILCILKGILPFKMHKIVYFFQISPFKIHKKKIPKSLKKF